MCKLVKRRKQHWLPSRTVQPDRPAVTEPVRFQILRIEKLHFRVELFPEEILHSLLNLVQPLRARYRNPVPVLRPQRLVHACRRRISRVCSIIFAVRSFHTRKHLFPKLRVRRPVLPPLTLLDQTVVKLLCILPDFDVHLRRPVRIPKRSLRRTKTLVKFLDPLRRNP